MSSYRENEHHGHADDFNVTPHIAPIKLYLAIFGTLIFFTIVTIALSYVHLGSLNLGVAILIATIKASLVATFFMHLKDDSRFNSLVFVGSLIFIGVFMVYTLNDTDHRGLLDSQQGVRVNPKTGEVAPGGRVIAAPAAAAAEHH